MQFDPVSLQVEAGDVKRFAQAVGAVDPLHFDPGVAAAAGLQGLLLPPTMLFCLRAQRSPILSILMALGFSNRPGRMFHGAQAFRFHKAACAGDRIIFQDHIEQVKSASDAESSSSVVVGTVVTNSGGETLCELSYKAVMLGDRARSIRAMNKQVEAVPLAVDCMEVVTTITKQLINDYGFASGDLNRIHIDDGFARSVGLPGVIGHGMLTMGQVVSAICRQIPVLSLETLSMNFRSFSRPGDTLYMRRMTVNDVCAGSFKIFNQDARPLAELSFAQRACAL